MPPRMPREGSRGEFNPLNFDQAAFEAPPNPVPGEGRADLVLFVVERDVVLDFVELFPRLFGSGFRS